MGGKESKIIGNGLYGNIRDGLTKEEDDRYDELQKKLKTSKSQKNIIAMEKEIDILENKMKEFDDNKIKKEADYKRDFNNFIDEYYSGQENENLKKGLNKTLESYLKQVFKNKDEEIKKWGSVYGAVFEKMLNRYARYSDNDERFLRLVVNGYKELDEISKEKVFDVMIKETNDYLDNLHKKIKERVESNKKSREQGYYKYSLEYENKINSLKENIKLEKDDYPKTKKAQLKADERISKKQEELDELIIKYNRVKELSDLEDMIDNIIYSIKKFDNIDTIELVAKLLTQKFRLSMFGDDKTINEVKETINQSIELLKPKEEIPNQLRYFQYYIDKRKKEIDDDFETTKKTAGDIHDYNVDLNEIKMDVMDYFKSHPELEKYKKIYNPFNETEAINYVKMQQIEQKKKQEKFNKTLQPKKETKKKVSKEDLMNLINEIEASLIKPKLEENTIEQGNMLIKQIEKKLKPKKETKKRVSKEDFQNLINEIQSSIIEPKPKEDILEQGNEIIQAIEDKLNEKYNKITKNNNNTLMNINYKINDLQNLLVSKEEEEQQITAYKFKNAEYENKELNKKHKALKKEIISIKKQIRENKKQMKIIKKENKEIIKVKPKETPLKPHTPGRQGYLRAILEQRGEKAFLKQLNYYKNETPYTKMEDKVYEDYLRMLEAYKEAQAKKKLEKPIEKEKKPRGRPKKNQ